MKEHNMENSEAIDPVIRKYVDEMIDKKIGERLSGIEARIEECLKQINDSKESGVSDRATIVVFSGDFDKLFAAFVIATGAAAMDMDVSMFFTFWGLTALKKSTIFAGKSLPEKMLSVMLPSGPGHTGTSKMNMFGIGPAFFKKLMKKNNVDTLPELISLAGEMGVRMVACQMSMDLMGIKREELLDNIDYGGVGTYLGDASDSKITLFI